jgi:hypothetical protein
MMNYFETLDSYLCEIPVAFYLVIMSLCQLYLSKTYYEKTSNCIDLICSICWLFFSSVTCELKYLIVVLLLYILFYFICRPISNFVLQSVLIVYIFMDYSHSLSVLEYSDTILQSIVKFIASLLCGLMFAILINLFEIRFVNPNYYLMAVYSCSGKLNEVCDLYKRFDNHHYDMVKKYLTADFGVDMVRQEHNEKRIGIATIKMSIYAGWEASKWFMLIFAIICGICCLYVYEKTYILISVIFSASLLMFTVAALFLCVRILLQDSDPQHKSKNLQIQPSLLDKGMCAMQMCSNNHGIGYSIATRLTIILICITVYFYNHADKNVELFHASKD